MARLNGSVPALRRTFVAEDQISGEGGGYQCRAKCTRCLPEWLGPVYRVVDEAAKQPGEHPTKALARIQNRAALDIKRHAANRHGGELR